MSPLEWIKTYVNIIIGVLVVILIATVSITINVLKSQRDKARKELAAAQELVKNYKTMSVQAQAHADEMMTLAASNEVANAEVIDRLKKEKASSDEEARKLAIIAGCLIGGLK